MEAKVYNQKGKNVGKIELPEDIFGLKWNNNLVHQVSTSIQSNMRSGTAHTKDRGEVAGGGRKPWQQKGLGRARHGSIRSPIWKGGGVAHGPKSIKNYDKKINKKMRAKALFTVLSSKMKKGQLIFLDSLSVPGKTKDAKEIISSISKISGLEKFSTKKRNVAFIGIPSRDEKTLRAFRNFGSIELDDVKNMNALSALSNTFVVIVGPEESIKFLESKIHPVKSHQKVGRLPPNLTG